MQQRLAAAVGDFAEPQHRFQALVFVAFELLVAFRLRQHLLVADSVLQAVGHPGGGGLAVTAGAAGFLVVGFDALGQVQVGDEAYVRFIDAHAERHRGHHHQAVLAQKALLVVGAHRAAQPGVVGQGGDALVGEPLGGLVHLVARQAVDDARLAGVFGAQQAQQLLAGAILALNAVLDVGPVKTGHIVAGAGEVQALGDFRAGARVRGGGERDARHLRELTVQQGKLQIVAAEIVTPLRHAVGLVDGEQRQRRLMQQLKRARLNQPLRRHVEQVQLAVAHLLLQGLALLGAERGVQEGGAHPQRIEGADLILHQRDQRAHHHAHAVADQRRNLVAQGFTAAGGHQHQGVVAVDQVVDDGALFATKVVITEDVL